MKIILKLTVSLLFVLILTTFVSCWAVDANEEEICKDCISAQIELCEAYGDSNCAENDKTRRLKEKVQEECLKGSVKIAEVQASCWRDNTTSCSHLGFTCN